MKECEEARGGVASTSMSHDLSSGDISSSSQVISQHLVDFRNIDELQEQNQRLLKVVRELSEQNEERERQTLEQQTEVLYMYEGCWDVVLVNNEHVHMCLMI